MSLLAVVLGRVPDMKIAVMTCWQRDDNYGTQLQCYALLQYLYSLGHDAYLIRYLRANDCISKNRWDLLKSVYKAFNPILFARFFKYKLTALSLEKGINDREAPLFREKYLNQSPVYNSWTELCANPPEADIYMVGSDQVWNIPVAQKNHRNAHFLNFGNESIKRISYAASFGFSSSNIQDGYVQAVMPLLKRFSVVSVREKDGVDVCDLMGVSARQVCDPTMLFDTTHYRELYAAEKIKRQAKPYVLIYWVGEKLSFKLKDIRNWARQKNLFVIFIPAHGRKEKIPEGVLENRATIPEWLSLVDNADYVVTNSFHCCIFSMLFHKKFVVFSLSAGGSFTNNRLEIVNAFCGQNRIVASKESFPLILEQQIDWDSYEQKRRAARDSGRQFLAEVLV